MSGNSIGAIFKLTTFGESHGEAVGGIIDGCPAGLKLDIDFIQNELNRRRATDSVTSTKRFEADNVEILSGHKDHITTGTPIGFIIKNREQKPSDYKELEGVYRPSHADYSWEAKYGIRDHSGGGRASARETVTRVVGGAIAKLFLSHNKISVIAWVEQIGKISITSPDSIPPVESIEDNILRCPDPSVAKIMLEEVKSAEKSGDTLGGIIACRAKGVPVGLGEPLFDKLEAELGKAILTIPSVKGVEFGSGFSGASMLGSEHNDPFVIEDNSITTQTNYSGGIQGGLSNGENVRLRIAFKPLSSIKSKQKTVNHKGEPVEIDLSKGRHDVCVLPRAVPVVEAMTALVFADMLLRNRCSGIDN